VKEWDGRILLVLGLGFIASAIEVPAFIYAYCLPAFSSLITLSIDHSTTAIMFENRRVYLLTGVAYMGAMLFGSSTSHRSEVDKHLASNANALIQVSTPVSWAQCWP
jgi:hypothetical protein